MRKRNKQLKLNTSGIVDKDTSRAIMGLITRKMQTNDAFQNQAARIGWGTPSLLEGTDYPLTRLTRDFQLFNSLYRSNWIIRRIIDTIPTDMTKNWYTLRSELTPQQIKKYEIVERKTRTQSDICKALKWGRLYGGAAALIIIDGHEDILEEPLELDTIMPSAYKGLIVLDRWSGITPDAQTVGDTNSPDYDLPKFYTITLGEGEMLKVHHSRILRFVGGDLPYYEWLAEMKWGISEVEIIFEELKKYQNTSFNLANLIFKANIPYAKMRGMDQLLGAADEKAQQEAYNILSAQNRLMNNFSLYVMGKDDDFGFMQYSFTGLSQLYELFMMDIAGASQIPATKLFGRAPQGMNATGESDMLNYENTITEKQEWHLRPALDKLIPIICMSTFGYVPDDLDYAFNPVRQPSDKELADLVKNKIESIARVYELDIINKSIAMKELKQLADGTGMFTNITDQDIVDAENEVPSIMGEEENQFINDANWEENEHPRDKDGKFSQSANSGSGGYSQATTKLLGKEYTGYKGQDAVKKLLEEKQGYIKNAFTRKDIGDIALIWGNDDVGLQHIIKRRTAAGEKTDNLLNELSSVAEKGALCIDGKGRFKITKEDKEVIVSPEMFNDKLSFLVTGYFINKKD